MAAGLFLTVSATSVTAAEKTPADRFRDLLSSPPAYVEVLWKEEAAGQGSGITPKFISTNVQLIRWQTNAYLMAFGNTPEQFAGPRWAVPSIHSRYGEEVWWADSLSVHYGVYSNNLANDTFKHLVEGESLACRCLTLGVILLKPGTARWTAENTFEGEYLMGTNVCRGEIVELDQGRVKALKFWSPALPRFTYTVRYEYENADLPPHIPSRINGEVINHKNPALSGRGWRSEILSWRSSDSPMPRDTFDPEGLMSANGIVPPFIVRYTNGVGYYEAGGALRTLGPLTLFQRLGWDDQWAFDWVKRIPYPESLDRANYAAELKRSYGVTVDETPESRTRLLLPAGFAFAGLALAVGLVQRYLKSCKQRAASFRD